MLKTVANAWLRIDGSRSARTGVPEVVYAESKTLEQIAIAMRELISQNDAAMATRVPEAMFDTLVGMFPHAHLDRTARCLRVGSLAKKRGRVAVVTAGTSDLPVAAEASFACEFFGYDVTRIADVGVAGLHRLLDVLPELRAADAIIVAAGMEGALPSVIAGLVPAMVVGVPTSVGYGVSAGGSAALATMLASCAPGIAVVNIDNGFGAAAVAHKALARSAA